MACSCEHDDEPSVCGDTELVKYEVKFSMRITS
jgi:hypothetical protein